SKADIASRAYIRFTALESLLAFHQAFQGHVFRDAKGQEFVAMVEFAPHQKVPPVTAAGASGKRQKEDARIGTIDEDPDYLAFFADLQRTKISDEADSEAV
ncbi:hypothetical protein K437DRAFT_216574, partial [Tilletiaria anomala UBC 951]